LLLTEAIGMKRGVWQPMKEGLFTATEKKGGIRFVNGWLKSWKVEKPCLWQPLRESAATNSQWKEALLTAANETNCCSQKPMEWSAVYGSQWKKGYSQQQRKKEEFAL
jgi:hypothetical protein